MAAAARPGKPNIVFVLTDDQDHVLGGSSDGPWPCFGPIPTLVLRCRGSTRTWLAGSCSLLLNRLGTERSSTSIFQK